MGRNLCRMLRIVVVTGIVAAGCNALLAVPVCPPLCLLPPDPAPPLPPMPVDDPPLRPMAATNPNSGNGAHSGTMATAHAVLTGKKQAGGECKSGKLEGTLVVNGNRYSCNFVPSTLPVGGACHAKGRIGAVAEAEGKRYCRIAP